MKPVKGTEAQLADTPGKIYYWRIDTEAPAASLRLVIGPLWKFTVR